MRIAKSDGVITRASRAVALYLALLILDALPAVQPAWCSNGVATPPLPSASLVDSASAVEALLPFLAEEGIRVSAEPSMQLTALDAVTVVTLERGRDENLLLYILHDGGHVFLRVGQTPSGETELRLWSSGREEVVFTPLAARMELGPSDNTFRLRDDALKSAKLSAGEVVDCIGRLLGLQEFSVANLLNVLGRSNCSQSTAIELVLTVTNCLDIPPSPMTVLGCVNGWAKLISCDLASCAASSCTSSITLGHAVDGSWISGCTSQHRSGRLAKYYTFVITAPTDVTVSLEATVDPYLYLIEGSGRDGRVITFDDDSGPGNDALIARTLSAGQYTIEATTYGSGATGTFTLRLTGGGGSVLLAPVTWQITDDCSDSRGLSVRFFDRTRGGTYPSTGAFRVPSGALRTFSFSAPRGSNVCIGGSTDPVSSRSWCYGINNDRDGSYSATCCAVVPPSGSLSRSNRLICP